MSEHSSTETRPLVVLAHAYSPQNRGDGLLVDLAKAVVDDAFGSAVDIKVVAVNAGAFEDPAFIQWGRWRRILPQRAALIAAGLTGTDREIRTAFARADAIVAVGGGYLRGSSAIEAVKSLLAHYAQLRSVARWGEKAVYLPQSIGPFPPFYERAVRKKLANLGAFYLRDDRSMSQFGDLPNACRTPDLAVLEIASNTIEPKHLAERAPVVVARELHDARNYPELLARAAESKWDWAVQSLGAGNNDVPITRQLSGRPSSPLLAEILSGAEGRVIVSTRLHGSLAALLAGHPTVHLSYERKGWGAFEDLGIPEYVLNARNARFEEVVALVDRIAADPDRYWAAIEAQRHTLVRQRDRLVEDVKRVAVGRSGAMAR